MSSERVAPHGIYPLAALTVDVVDTAKNVVSVVIAGELDADTAPGLSLLIERLVNREQPQRLILDLTAIVFLSAAGIRAFLQGARTVNAYGGVLVLRRPAPFIRYVLDVAGVLGHVDLDDAEKPAT